MRRTLNDKMYTILKTVLTTAVLRLVNVGGWACPRPSAYGANASRSTTGGGQPRTLHCSTVPQPENRSNSENSTSADT